MNLPREAEKKNRKKLNQNVTRYRSGAVYVIKTTNATKDNVKREKSLRKIAKVKANKFNHSPCSVGSSVRYGFRVDFI